MFEGARPLRSGKIRPLHPRIGARNMVTSGTQRPANFHDAAMFAEHTDAVITHVASHDVHKVALQKSKWGNFQRSTVPMKSNGDTSTSGIGGPEPMELGTASRRALMRAEYEKLRAEKACFICQKPGHLARNCPTKENRRLGNGMSS